MEFTQDWATDTTRASTAQDFTPQASTAAQVSTLAQASTLAQVFMAVRVFMAAQVFTAAHCTADTARSQSTHHPTDTPRDIPHTLTNHMAVLPLLTHRLTWEAPVTDHTSLHHIMVAWSIKFDFSTQLQTFPRNVDSQNQILFCT